MIRVSFMPYGPTMDGPHPPMTTTMTPPPPTAARAASLAEADHPREASLVDVARAAADAALLTMTMMIMVTPHHGPMMPGVDPTMTSTVTMAVTTVTMTTVTMTTALPTVERVASLAETDHLREARPVDAERAAEDAAAPHQATTMMIIHHPPGTAEMDGSEYGRLLPHGMKVPAAAAVPAAVAQYQASLEARVERAVVDFKYREWCHT
mmetsp:Transcript_17663/g.38544  ORF Transcript_17663/g.38544 Transcript_17663/m.38544 type:complete len:209 (-) Transcript_17663:216-842(-)